MHVTSVFHASCDWKVGSTRGIRGTQYLPDERGAVGFDIGKKGRIRRRRWGRKVAYVTARCLLWNLMRALRAPFCVGLYPRGFRFLVAKEDIMSFKRRRDVGHP